MAIKNRETEAAWSYHNDTKHSYQSVRSNPHYLDWKNQPIPFKVYSELAQLPLRQHLSASRMPALAAISSSGVQPDVDESVTGQTLAEILFLSAGITRRRNYPGGEMLFRAAACTGALYHIDLYLGCGELADLAAGVYQFSPQDFSLRQLRAGDYRGLLLQAGGQEPSLVNTPCVIIGASTFWRNAWKYQARAYRHCYWDNGTLLANLLAAAAARGVRANVLVGFVDRVIAELLGLDRKREAALSLVALGRSKSNSATTAIPAMTPLNLQTVPLSKTEVDYPAMRAMHEASSLESEAEVVAWREAGRGLSGGRIEAPGERSRLFPLAPLRDDEIPQDNIEETILRRGSTRQFAREPVTFAQLSTMLDRATRGIPADFLNSAAESLNDLYLIVHAVEGLPPGAYFYERNQRALQLLKEGDFRRDAGYLGLGQEIPADCSVNVYFLTDLDGVLQRYGNRGYRAAQLEAAIMGGRFYLAAYALGLGASGLTFFDDDVTEFFSPHAADKSVMFLIALGKSAKRQS